VTDYTADNLRQWDERAPAHAASSGYAVDRFLADPDFLSHVVRFDVPRLGDVRGLRGVHLQCHIGTDTVSLARLGATMSGLDFSPAAVTEARRLSDATGAGVEFVVGDVYAAPDLLGRGEYDLVFTGIGALCWLPDVRRWAQVVADLLRPGGRLFIREGHPVLWSLDETKTDGTLLITHPYVETELPDSWDEPGTYVPTEVEFQHNVGHTWNHGLGEIITAVLDAGLQLTALVEHDSVPWNAFDEGAMEKVELDEWRLKERPARLPHSYTLQAVKAS
jgi:SAM-dependent methyltransferase